jgi:hypothetical protein
MKKSKLIIRFLRIGRLLHFVAALAFSITVISFIRLININFYSDNYSFFIWIAIFILFFSMSILAELDGYSRFQNYKQVKDQIYLNGFQERLLKPLMISSCQREAALLAGEELDCFYDVKNYFYSRGYRWYHILPDFVFKNPLFFFRNYFWRTTFFTPYYEPKVNFDQLNFLQV